jgi:hypothetical protein
MICSGLAPLYQRLNQSVNLLQGVVYFPFLKARLMPIRKLALLVKIPDTKKIMHGKLL